MLTLHQLSSCRSSCELWAAPWGPSHRKQLFVPSFNWQQTRKELQHCLAPSRMLQAVNGFSPGWKRRGSYWYLPQLCSSFPPQCPLSMPGRWRCLRISWWWKNQAGRGRFAQLRAAGGGSRELRLPGGTRQLNSLGTGGVLGEQKLPLAPCRVRAPHEDLILTAGQLKSGAAAAAWGLD